MSSVRTFGDTAVSPHHLATAAAMEALAVGGNAVDAVIAADAVLGVVAPETCGIGGDLFALVWRPDDRVPWALNASGTAGSGASADAELLRSAGHTSIPDLHPATVTVPGCVAGWGRLAETHARLPLSRTLEPAVRLAEEGFPVSSELAAALGVRAGELAASIREEFYPGDRIPPAGSRLRRPRLATTLAAIAEEGPDAFYRGRPAIEISRVVGGRLTLADLAGYLPIEVQPLGMEVAGLWGWTVPPNSQGYLVLTTLAVFERCDPPDDPEHPDWWHLLVEAYRAAAANRTEVLADPGHVPPEFAATIHPGNLDRLADAIDRHRARRWEAPPPAPGGTAFMCAVDRHGMAVSLIQSNFHGLGTNLAAADSGFVLHNRGAGFDLRPGHPNELGPGKRPLHTLSPTLWTTRSHRLAAVLGTRGGHQQPQILAQMAARLFRNGMAPDEAQRGPRWTIDDHGSGLMVEDRVPGAIVTELVTRGHRVSTGPDWNGSWGPVSVITVEPGGLRTAAADPRVDTTAAAAR